MSEFFLQYGLFLTQTVTVVIAIVFVIAFATSASKKGRESGGLVVKSLNQRLEKLSDALRAEILDHNIAALNNVLRRGGIARGSQLHSIRGNRR